MAQLPHNPRREPSGRVAGPESPPPLPSLTKPPLTNLCGQQVHLSVDPAVQPALPARLSAPTKRTTQALLNSILEIEPMVTPERFMKNLSAVLSFSVGSERLRRMLGEGSYANARASVIMANDHIADGTCYFSPFLGSAERASDLIVGTVAAVLASTPANSAALRTAETQLLTQDLIERISRSAGMLSHIEGAAPGISFLARRKLEDLALFNPPFRPAISQILHSWGESSAAADLRMKEATNLLLNNSLPGFLDELEEDRKSDALGLNGRFANAAKLVMSPLNAEARDYPFSSIVAAAEQADILCVDAVLSSGQLLASQYGAFLFSVLSELGRMGYQRVALDSHSFINRHVLSLCETIGAPETLDTLGAKAFEYLNRTSARRGETLCEHLDLPSHRLHPDARMWLTGMDDLRREASRLGITFCTEDQTNSQAPATKTLILNRTPQSFALGRPAVRLLSLNVEMLGESDALLVAAAREAASRVGLGEKLALGINKDTADRIFSLCPDSEFLASIGSEGLRAYLSRSDVVLHVLVDPRD
jgi:hypothetical protein